VAACLLPFATAAQPRSGPDRAGVFDYYVLAISWTPSWCAAEGDRRGDARCDRGSGMGLALHGLWPQFERGWPEYCLTPHRDPTRAETAAMADLTGSAGLAWHQWNRHGRCSGLSAVAYFDLMRQAITRIALPHPAQFGQRVVPARLAAAFRAANPRMPASSVVVTCRAGRIEEVRICLTRAGLSFRDCAPDLLQRSCRAGMAELPPVR
jgi:ribonuclease T2